AMYSYAGQSSSATKQTPFKEAPKITNDSGTANQTAAVTNATGNSTATNTSKILQTMATPGSGGTDPTAGGTTPTATPAASGGSTSGSLSDLVSAYNPFSSLFYNTEGLPYFSIGMGNNFVQIGKSLGLITSAAPAAAKALPALGGLGGMLGGGAAAAHPVAALGSA
ncbi:hypothetical protein BST31_25825, partial [Mycobacterium marseillense]